MSIRGRWGVAVVVALAGCAAFESPYLAGQRRPPGQEDGPSAEAGSDDAAGAPRRALGPEELAQREWTEADVERGRRIYLQACTSCHGVQGTGAGPQADALDPRPRDFTRGQFKWRSTASGLKPLDADLFQTISEGVPGTSMPGWRQLLGPEDRWRVMLHVKTFAPDVFGEEIDPTLDVVAVPDVVAPTPESVARGRAVYDELGCAKCHGEAGHGDGPSAATLTDDAGYPIRPFDFTTGSYRCGSGPLAIYRTFLTGLDGTPMPSFAGSVSESDRWPLVHYVMSLEEGRSALETLVGIGLDPNRPATSARNHSRGER